MADGFGKYIIAFGVIGVLVVTIVTNFLIDADSYSAAKLNNFFITSLKEASNDGSGSFRLESFKAAYEIWTESLKTTLFGVGYGQAYASLQGGTIYTIVGGNDVMSMLTSIGFFGYLSFLFIYFKVIRLCLRIRRIMSKDQQISIWTEKVIFLIYL